MIEVGTRVYTERFGRGTVINVSGEIFASVAVMFDNESSSLHNAIMLGNNTKVSENERGSRCWYYSESELIKLEISCGEKTPCAYPLASKKCTLKKESIPVVKIEPPVVPVKEIVENKFKVGDIICGITSAPYVFTNKDMVRGEVVSILDSDRIGLKILSHKEDFTSDAKFEVESKYFDLVIPEVKPEIKVGDTVVFINEKKHIHEGWCYPAVGTLGTVKGIWRTSLEVRWADGSTERDINWTCATYDVILQEKKVTPVEVKGDAITIGATVFFKNTTNNRKMHQDYPRYYPKVGTKGTVQYIYSDSCSIKWEDGSTAQDDIWMCGLDQISTTMNARPASSGKPARTDGRVLLSKKDVATVNSKIKELEKLLIYQKDLDILLDIKKLIK